MPAPPFRLETLKFTYQLHYHIGFQTRRRVPIFHNPQRMQTLRAIITDVCAHDDLHILDMETDHLWVRLLLSLKPTHAPAWCVKKIKNNVSRLFFQAFPESSQEIGGRALWSRGYYVRGLGDVPNHVVREYVASQRQHHEGPRLTSFHLAQYSHPNPAPLFDLRPTLHCMAEYNCHLVCCPIRHEHAIDKAFAEPLMEYLLRVGEAREFETIEMSILSDHLHLFAGLRTTQSPAEFALTVLNNTSHWLHQHNPGVFKLWDTSEFWTSSAFVRTAGAATTNQVRAHLRAMDAGS